MKLRASLVLAVLALGVAAVASAALATPTKSAANAAHSVVIPANGTTTTNLPVTGTFTITKFTAVKGVMSAVGTFTGSVNGAAQVTSAATAPVTAINGNQTKAGTRMPAAAAASCSILSLTLGPLHLNLLGLVVDLNQVNLNITAQSGPGNLLGNLLCSVAGLLDDNPTGALLQGLLLAISNVLNGLLAGL